MTGRPVCLGLLFLLPATVLAAGGDTAAPAKAAIHGPLSPEQALPLFRVPPGLRVELVAAEPDVESPVAMTFDEDGRLWVVEMRDYPNGPPAGQPPQGRIRLLEDRAGTGRYKATGVFAEGLLFGNGILPWRGGVLVTAAPNILYLKDSDGDGKADVRRKLYEGFAVDNPQLRVSHPNLGIDNWIYVANGLRGGKVRRSGQADANIIDISGRDFRFDLIGQREEAVTGMGQYGNTFDDWGQRFVCSNRNHWVHMVLPEHYVRRNPYLAVPPPHRDDQKPGGAARVYPLSKQVTTAAEHAGHFTAACGVFVYRGDLLPEQYRGCVFTCEPTGNLVHQEVLLPKGASFTGRPARPGVEFLATPDDWCRPVFLTHGPDGALYVVDMYRKVIEHPQWMPPGPLKTSPDLLLGKDKGRIWRIVPDGYKGLRERPRLSKATTQELGGLLGSANAWRRTTAQRLLLERQDPQAEEPLRKLVASSDQPLARVHAAWLLEQRGKLDADLVLHLLRHEQPRVREHGVRLSERWLATAQPLQQRVLELARDEDARVRFQVALSLGEWDDPRILPALAHIAVAGVDDPWVRLAVASSVPTRAGALLAILLKPAQGLTKQATPERLLLVQEISALVGGRQDPHEVAALLETVLALAGKEAGTWQLAARKGLAEGALRRGTQLSALLQKLPPERRGLVEKMEALMGKSLSLARDGKGSTPERVEAVRQLAHADWKTAGPVLTRLVSEEPAEVVRLAAVRAAAVFPNKEVPDLLVRSWKAYPAGVKREVLEAMLSSPERTLALLEDVEAGRISAGELDALRRVQLLNHRRSDVRDRARKVLETAATPERRKVLDQYRPALKLVGDAGRGRQVFQKATCASCHRVGGIGVDVGPSLADVRTRAPEALLVDILDPNAAIDANYISYLVSTKSGKLLTGLIAAETASSIVLRRAEQQTDTILRQDIEPDGVLSTGKSLMPEGLEKDLSVQDMADLLAFLREGRVVEGRAAPAGPSASPKPLPHQVVTAWEAAGAKVGWVRVDKFGHLTFVWEEEGKPGDLPAFRLDRWQGRLLAKLPAPATAFGLDLSDTEVTDAELKDLPRLKSLQSLDLAWTQLTDAGLKELAGRKTLRTINLDGTAVTDAGLKELAALKNLQALSLAFTPVTGTGLKELAALKNLQALYFADTKITDAGMKELARLTSLQRLFLRNTLVTDVGLNGLAGLKNLKALYFLTTNKITDAGLKKLGGLTSLQTLNLVRTPLTDAGLKGLAGLKNLQTLELSYTKITDAGLKGLAELKNLETLDLSNTLTTDAGLKELAGLKSLRKVILDSTPVRDTGLKELGGLKQLQTLDLSHTPLTGTGLKELVGLKGLQELYLHYTKITDAGLKELAGLKNLQTLDLSYSSVTDAGLKELAALKNLQTLDLSCTKITDAGLKELPGLKKLRTLNLYETQVADAGLKELGSRKGLQALNLGGTQVTDAGLKELAGLKGLQKLSLHYTKITDAGLKELAGLKGLQELSLHYTQITDAGVKELVGLKNLQQLLLGKTKVTDTGLKELVGLTSLRILDLPGTQVTAAGVKELQMALRLCRISP